VSLPVRNAPLTSHQQAEVHKRRADGETLKALAKSYGVTRPTIMRALRKFEVPISAEVNLPPSLRRLSAHWGFAELGGCRMAMSAWRYSNRL
jgi:hypothetical protein